MSEATLPLNDPEVLNNGTPAGLFLFLTLAAQRGDLPKAQTDNLRVGVRKVLDVVHVAEDLDLRTADLDDIVRRFHTLSKVALKDETRQTYEKRLRDAVDRYRKFLADDSAWKQTAVRKPKSTSSTKRSASNSAPEPEAELASVTVLPGAHLMEFPVPLRRGVVAKLFLPTDLTEREAKRIGEVAKALAGGEQLALPAGTSETG